MRRRVVLAVLVALVACRDRREARIEPPVVAVTVHAPGLGAAEIERAVSMPIELALAELPSVRTIRSESRSDLAVIVAELRDEGAQYEAPKRIDAIRNQLPDDALPEITYFAPDVPYDVVLAVRGTRTPLELRQVALDWIAPRVQQLVGIGEVRLRGGQERRFDVRVDPARLDAMGVTVLDIADALANDIDLPAGQLDTGGAVRVIARAGEGPKELRMRVIAQRNGAPIRIGDVASIVEDLVPAQAEPLQLGIRLTRNADHTRLAAQIVQAIRTELPSGVSVTSTPPVPRAPRVTLIGDDSTALARAADQIAQALDIEVPHEPSVELEVDPGRAARLGVSPTQIRRAIAVSLGRPVATTSDSTDVVLRVPDPEQLQIRGGHGELVPLSDLVTRQTREGEAVRVRIDRRPAVELTVPGGDPANLRRRVAALGLPPAIRVQVR